jgi:hypothetical protein
MLEGPGDDLLLNSDNGNTYISQSPYRSVKTREMPQCMDCTSIHNPSIKSYDYC